MKNETITRIFTVRHPDPNAQLDQRTLKKLDDDLQKWGMFIEQTMETGPLPIQNDRRFVYKYNNQSGEFFIRAFGLFDLCSHKIENTYGLAIIEHQDV